MANYNNNNNNNNGGGAQSQIDSLIQMNDLQQLIKDFTSPRSALGGLEMFGGGSAPESAVRKIASILQGQEMVHPKWRPGMTAEERKPYMAETPYNITDIVSMISEGKDYKDRYQPGWNAPQIGGGGIGGSIQREPEKAKGIIALLQRLLPGGKTGYR